MHKIKCKVKKRTDNDRNNKKNWKKNDINMACSREIAIKFSRWIKGGKERKETHKAKKRDRKFKKKGTEQRKTN